MIVIPGVASRFARSFFLLRRGTICKRKLYQRTLTANGCNEVSVPSETLEKSRVRYRNFRTDASVMIRLLANANGYPINEIASRQVLVQSRLSEN